MFDSAVPNRHLSQAEEWGECGVKWSGVEWIRVKWREVKWTGVEWCDVECGGVMWDIHYYCTGALS